MVGLNGAKDSTRTVTAPYLTLHLDRNPDPDVFLDRDSNTGPGQAGISVGINIRPCTFKVITKLSTKTLFKQNLLKL